MHLWFKNVSRLLISPCKKFWKFELSRPFVLNDTAAKKNQATYYKKNKLTTLASQFWCCLGWKTKIKIFTTSCLMFLIIETCFEIRDTFQQLKLSPDNLHQNVSSCSHHHHQVKHQALPPSVASTAAWIYPATFYPNQQHPQPRIGKFYWNKKKIITLFKYP